MNRIVTRSVLFAGFLALLVLADIPQARTEGVQAAMERQTIALLNEPLEMKDFQNAMTLKEAMGLLMEKFAARDKHLAFIIDNSSFRRVNPKSDVHNVQIQLQPFPSRMPTITALRLILSQVEEPEATFLIRDGIVVITAAKKAGLKQLLEQKVTAKFAGTPLAEALEELSAQSGVSIVLDGRQADKTQTTITAVLKNDVSLDAALRMLTDMADLTVVKLPAGIYVTSPANARLMQQEGGKKKGLGGEKK